MPVFDVWNGGMRAVTHIMCIANKGKSRHLKVSPLATIVLEVKEIFVNERKLLKCAKLNVPKPLF